MRHLQPLDPIDAPDRPRQLLEEIISRRGTIGDMVRTMAHSPALLQGYLDFSRAMKRAKLPQTLSEKLSLAVQEWIGCDHCLTAHAEAGRAAGLSDSDITLARQGTATDSREATLVGFAVRVLVESAAITADDMDELRTHGWNDRIIAEVVGLVTLNLLTGAFNLVAGIEPVSAAASDMAPAP